MLLIFLSCLFLAKAIIELIWGPSFPIKLFFNDFRIDMKKIDVDKFRIIDLVSSLLLSVLCVLLFLTGEKYLAFLGNDFYVVAILAVCVITVALLQKTKREVTN